MYVHAECVRVCGSSPPAAPQAHPPRLPCRLPRPTRPPPPAVGIFPYVLKLLQTTAADLRQTLVLIWAKIMAWDTNSQVPGGGRCRCACLRTAAICVLHGGQPAGHAAPLPHLACLCSAHLPAPPPTCAPIPLSALPTLAPT